MKYQIISNWMSPNPITVTPETLVSDASDILDCYKIRRLPVVDDAGNLVGIVTTGDIREASGSDATSLSVWELNYLLAKLKIRRIMTAKPVTIDATDTISQAATLMLKHKISGLPVTDRLTGALVGIITESDIFRLVAKTWQDADPAPAKADRINEKILP